MFQCLPGLYIAVFDKVQEEKAKCHPLTRFALMALARKKSTVGYLCTDLQEENYAKV